MIQFDKFELDNGLKVIVHQDTSTPMAVVNVLYNVGAKDEDPHKTLAIARIENHYFFNHSFFPSDAYLLEHAPELSGIPTRIIQGRYDMVCPIRSAWDLKLALPAADLRIVPDGGHSIKDPGIAAGLVQATEEFKRLRWQAIGFV